MTPAESKHKMDALVAELVRFEELIDRDSTDGRGVTIDLL